MAVRADNGEFVQFDSPPFGGSLAEWLEVMDVRELFPKLAVGSPEIEAAARDLTFQDTLVIDEGGFDLQ
ncbi:hypothetical protein BDS110ZK23_37530 [Bradyrhizobium diazoefficiens]|uniref:Uncharacterized protein n=1 Tax=Bradyrhizobium diazoefficiens TaxID=1355477 RepID=A0A810C865_9BRAD|nr:hypothetical protein XF9B_52240 [Bradyrhizobium diazoefficiens]BCF01297.1 hypothetical protein XF11B_53170 [Bradyrhizobium diazoefficiens]BCF09888.1 hypothetical protein XF12B_52610 [Bradyrhizobium diazoefficiens]BCF62332.1 hypothetical protein XF18B_52800 [Bradyrhizobium diazoefficiens]